ncbi:MAG TPA: alpha/beta fold hydrolase [Chitinophagaceae bacterium]|nr:alpha/beta fold hydrolase [Chitinophagaceae bacterium]
MRQILISAADGYQLSALYATPVGSSCGAVIISSAAGIKKEFYIHFSKYLVQHGYNVLLYDYRGVGGSVAKGIVEPDAFMHDWGILDMNAVLNYMVFERGQREIIWIGHCIGAQLTGFLRNTQYVKKVIAVNAASGYWGNLPFPRRVLAWAFSFLVSPLLLKLYGYGSLGNENLDKPLPKNAFLEWQHWCKSKNFYQQFLTEHFNTDKFYSFRIPVTSVYTSDDYMANDKTARVMLSFFPNAPARIIKLQVERYTAHKVGHAGIFCKKFHRDLWNELIKIIES